MRVALLGAGGQLAHDLLRELSRHEVAALSRAEADLTDADGLRETLQALKPHIVVNSAAYNLVDQAEREPEAAFAVNAHGARTLARVCDDIGAALVHFSTDYVFGLDADRTTPWKEDDLPGPVSVYGLSKLAGEYGIRAHCPRHFILRTCGLYGVKGSRGKGGNFVETMLRLADVGKLVRVVADQRCTPSSTADVARAAAPLMTSDAFGLYHVTNADSCSWFEFAREIFRLVGKDVDCLPITSAEFGALARRPAYSALDVGKLTGLGLGTPPAWQDALARYLAARAPR